MVAQIFGCFYSRSISDDSLFPPQSAYVPVEGAECGFDCGFGNEDAKQFGKLSKTATWEAMLETFGVPFPVDNSSVDTEDTEESD
jgi:hypothetical protein